MYVDKRLAGVTDPNLVYNLRAKLDATGYYDDNEIERVVAVEMNPCASQSELSAALEFEREREGVDLSKGVLTHHKLKNQGKRDLPLGDGEAEKLKPLTDPDSGEAQE